MKSSRYVMTFTIAHPSAELHSLILEAFPSFIDAGIAKFLTHLKLEDEVRVSDERCNWTDRTPRQRAKKSKRIR